MEPRPPTDKVKVTPLSCIPASKTVFNAVCMVLLKGPLNHTPTSDCICQHLAGLRNWFLSWLFGWNLSCGALVLLVPAKTTPTMEKSTLPLPVWENVGGFPLQ